ncbi:MAG: MFS transporter [Dehalococcoidia bacterium]|nr:MAG: MFS transporter [Dehalococcoidia bacterium]
MGRDCRVRFDKEAFPLVSANHHNENTTVSHDAFYYGWVIVAVCTILMTMQAGIMYSYGVFFKHLVANFGRSRAATSGVHSLFMITHGGFAIAMGWLVDRFGPAKVMAFCSFIVGLGLVLTSQANALWQLYVTYGLILGIGMSALFTTSTATTARWFTERRGLALGIVTSGVGLGTFLVPVAERLIATFGWSMAYFILGVAAWAVMIPGALFLRRAPGEKQRRAYGGDESIPPPDISHEAGAGSVSAETGITMKAAARYKPLWMLFSVYFLFNFCLQMVMIHLVNYATDIGIASLIAATFISIIGVGSFLGRLIMGTASDRIGSHNALLICCIILMITLVFLVFTQELWMFYLFAIIFGLAYGGEVPQMAVLVGHFFGLRAVAALVGVVVFGATIGGAIGAWVGGQVFDVTQSYQLAFTIAAIVSLLAVIITLMLKKAKAVIPG